MEINTLGEPLNKEFNKFNPSFDINIKLNTKNIQTILWWLHVHNGEVDMDVQDVAAYKKIIKMLPDNEEKGKITSLYDINHKLNSQDY